MLSLRDTEFTFRRSGYDLYHYIGAAISHVRALTPADRPFYESEVRNRGSLGLRRSSFLKPRFEDAGGGARSFRTRGK